jgi:hypothetical protein
MAVWGLETVSGHSVTADCVHRSLHYIHMHSAAVRHLFQGPCHYLIFEGTSPSCPTSNLTIQSCNHSFYIQPNKNQTTTTLVSSRFSRLRGGGGKEYDSLLTEADTAHRTRQPTSGFKESKWPFQDGLKFQMLIYLRWGLNLTLDSRFHELPGPGKPPLLVS